MGLLSLGTPLPWDEAKKHAEHVRKHGILQFINIWNRVKTRRKDHLLWGDEVEYMVVKFDHENKRAKLSLDAYDALLRLEQLEADSKQNGQVHVKDLTLRETFPSSWKPEYGRYMLEGTPGLPYGSTLKHLLDVEPNMAERRKLARQYLSNPDDEDVLTLTSFPLLGAASCFLFTTKEMKSQVDVTHGASRSLFVPDVAINPHARFSTLTRNIRLRRGSKVAINVPVFKDTHTPSPFSEPIPESIKQLSLEDLESIRIESNSLGVELKPLDSLQGKGLPDVIPDAQVDNIYLDCMCFGMGCSCLQVTFQACSVEEARRLYDQLAVLSPIMLALTAAAPIFKGYLADVDCRWNIIAGSVDDRTKEERGIHPLKENRFKIPKSRYDSITQYLSPGPSYSGGCGPDKKDTKTDSFKVNGIDSSHASVSAQSVHGDFFKPDYDDLNSVYDEKIFAELKEAGVDELLARHYAHLFIRDPLVIFRELLDQDDLTSSDHFEASNIQSTNWQTMRFKPPPPTAPNIGWRVEFRSMEIQLTDFENAAFSIFVVLLTRTILSFDLNFYIELSKVDENMVSAQKRNAALNQKFWFRKNVFGKLNQQQLYTNGNDCCDPDSDVRRGKGRLSIDGLSDVASKEDQMEDDGNELMTINEIINGKDSFPGLIPLISSYLSSMPLEHSVATGLERYLDLIRKKASGEIPTTASWIRNFVEKHPDYHHDSKISDLLNYDLLQTISKLSKNNSI